jgi:hypothetical protein
MEVRGMTTSSSQFWDFHPDSVQLDLRVLVEGKELGYQELISVPFPAMKFWDLLNLLALTPR